MKTEGASSDVIDCATDARCTLLYLGESNAAIDTACAVCTSLNEVSFTGTGTLG